MSTRTFLIPLAIAGAIGIGFVQACTTTTVTDAPIAGIDVTPATATLQAGGTQQFAATVRDDRGNPITQAVVSWTSSSTAIATVSENGLVRGVSVGTTTIRASFQGASGTASVTVDPGPSIVVSADSASLFGTTGTSPVPTVLQITNGGAGALTGLSASVEYLSGTGGWLPATLGSSSAPTTLTLSAVSTGLPVGVYRAVVTISGVAGNSPLLLPVKLTVTENDPIIRLTPASLTINAFAGTAPQGAALVQVSNGGGGTLTGLTSTVWYLGSSAGWLSASLGGPVAPTQLSVSADASSLSPGTYRGEVRIGSPVAVNDQEALPVTLLVTAPPTTADVAVSASGPASASTGSRISYNVTVQNLGPDAAQGIQVAFALPSDVAFVSTTDGGHDGGVVSWSIPSLPAGGAANTTVVVDVSTGASGTLVATASATSTNTDPVAGNNTATVSTTVGAPESADVSVVKVGTSQVAAGGQVSYTVTVTNAGPDPAVAVVVVDQLPAGLTYVSSTAGSHAGGSVTWNVGGLAAGTSRDLTIVAQVGSGVADTVTNQVQASAATPDPAVPNNSAQAKTFVANFSVSKATASVSESGTTETFDVVLGGRPSSSVEIDVTASDPGEATVDKATLTFGAGNWNVPQTVTITGVNDNLIDGPQASTITLSIDDAASADAFDALADKTIAVTTSDNDAPGFTITESGGSTQVNESGTKDTVTVALTAQPASNVVLTVVSGDVGEATVDKATLTFGSGNWSNPQTVVVTGVDDPDDDGPQVTTITIAVDDSQSDDAYDPVPDQTVSVTTVDNDQAGIQVTPTNAGTLVAEGGATDTIFVALAAAPPVGQVNLIVTNLSVGQVTLSETGLTFTKGNWNNPQKVVVAAVNDAVVEPLRFATARISVDDANSDDTYDLVPDQDVSITVVDNDSPSFTVTQTNGATVVSETGVKDTVTVVLDRQPSGPVVISISSADATEVTPDSASVTFSSANWSAPKIVPLSGVADGVDDANQNTVVTFSVNDAASDDGYDPAADRTVNVTTVAPPKIGLGSTAIGFAALTGGANPAEQTVSISNLGGGTLNALTAPITYTSAGSGWLAATLDATTAPTTLRLNASTGALSAGTYTADVQVTSAAAGVVNSPQTVSVTFTVTDPPPTIQLSSTSLGFTAAAGTGATSEQTIQITNSGGGTLNLISAPINFHSGLGWLGVSLDGTTAPTTLRVTANTGALAAGVYTATVAVTSGAAGVTNSPQNVSVTFTVTAPTIQLSPTAANFSAVVGGANPAQQVVNVTNSGTGTLDQLTAPITYTSAGSGWLNASLNVATAPATLTLSPTTGALAVGVYTADVNVTSGAAGVTNSPQTVSVTFTVSEPPPTIQLGGTTATFTAPVGGANPGEQTISISNSGGGTLNQLTAPVTYTSAGSGWLSASIAPTTAPTTLRLNATTGALAAGTYTATVAVTSGAAGVTNSPQNVSVTFTVTAPTIQLSATAANFSAVVGGANPAQQLVNVTNSGTGTLDQLTAPITYTSAGSGWLSASLNVATAPATLTLSPTTGALAAGVYTADVDVTSAAAGVTNSPQTVSVTFTVSEPPPTIQLGGTTATFTAPVGGANPGEETISISNSGGGTLDQLTAPISYGSGSGWLEATLDDPTAPTTLRLNATTGALAAGTYTATVAVTSAAAGVTNSPQNISVTFTVTAPTIQLASGTASFSATSGGGDPSEQTIAVTNAGNGTLGSLTAPITYTSAGSGWLSADLDAPTAPTTLRLNATTGALAPGTYTADVDVTSATSGVTNSPQTVAVTFEVSAELEVVLLSVVFEPMEGFTTAADRGAEASAATDPTS